MNNTKSVYLCPGFIILTIKTLSLCLTSGVSADSRDVENSEFDEV